MTGTAATSAATKGLSKAGQAFFGSLCVGTCVLGIWQTVRYYEKTAAVEERNAALAKEAMPVTARNIALLQDQSWQKWLLKGRFLHQHEVLVGPRGPPPSEQKSQQSGGGGTALSPSGYYVVTPFLLQSEEEAKGSKKTKRARFFWGGEITSSEQQQQQSCVVWVNRGWIPRKLVPDAWRSSPTRDLSSTRNRVWERSSTYDELTVVVPLQEKPRFLVAEHNYSFQPARFFWFDIVALTQFYKLASGKTTTAMKGIDEAGAGNEHLGLSEQRLPLVTLVRTTDDYSKDESSPLAPPASVVGDFTISPVIHVGYAVTWYGLSAAGLYMTRMLLKRGH